MAVSDVVKKSGRPVLTLESGRSVDDAIEAMNAGSAGALIVTEKGRPVGIFAKRDVLRTYLRDKGQSFAAVRLGDAMTAKLTSAKPGDPIEVVMQVMLEAGIGHLPVIEDEKVIGLLTAGDLVEYRLAALDDELHHLKEYIADLHEAGLD
ncbi:MAG: CBS domain-containing protein [Desulfobacterales bacterium]